MPKFSRIWEKVKFPYWWNLNFLSAMYWFSTIDFVLLWTISNTLILGYFRQFFFSILQISLFGPFIFSLKTKSVEKIGSLGAVDFITGVAITLLL